MEQNERQRMADSVQIKKDLSQLGRYLKQELQKELVLQKHKASGELIDSIEMVVEETLGKIILTERHLFYGDFVDRGRRAGTKRVPIAALEQWVRLKGFAPGNERGVAFAIQKKIFEEGIPTNNSRTLAPRRLNWLTGTVQRNQDRINEVITGAAFKEVDVLFNEILRQTNERIRAIQR